MHDHHARMLADRLASHPSAENGALVARTRGVVRHLMAERMPGAIAGIAIDESGRAAIVGVRAGTVIRLRVTGTSTDDMKIESELLRVDHPEVRAALTEEAIGGNFSGGLAITRRWQYDLPGGRSIVVETQPESGEEEQAFEAALAKAAGWLTSDS